MMTDLKQNSQVSIEGMADGQKSNDLSWEPPLEIFLAQGRTEGPVDEDALAKPRVNFVGVKGGFEIGHGVVNVLGIQSVLRMMSLHWGGFNQIFSFVVKLINCIINDNFWVLTKELVD